jgi:Ca-activated chloride channel family protein
VIGMQSNDSDLSRLNRALDASLRQARQNDTRLRWQDRGWWLLWPVALLLLLRLRSVAPVLLLLPLFTAPSAQADELELWRLWRTPDQHATHLFAQGDYREAARLFSSPLWRGAALYRAGDYEAALSAFEQSSDARAYYNQGNALARLERYAEAAERFQLALAEVPRWRNAQDNYDLVLRLAKRAEDDGRSGEPGQAPDEIRFDLEKNRGIAASALQSREEQARLWLDTLETSPAGYLKRRMMLQLQHQEGSP